LKELHKCPQQIPKQSAPSLAARARRRSSPTENSFGSNRSPRHKARICAREMEGRFIPSLDYGLHLLGSLFFLEPLLVDRRRRTALLGAVARYGRGSIVLFAGCRGGGRRRSLDFRPPTAGRNCVFGRHVDRGGFPTTSLIKPEDAWGVYS